MKLRVFLLSLVGLAILTGLLAWKGSEQVLTSVAGAGWGVLLVVLFHLAPMGVDTLGWRALLDRDRRPPYLALLRRRWIGESVNGLLPVAQVGGELLRARLLMQRRIDGATAGASVLVDVTIGFTMQLLFALLGVAMLARVTDDPALERGLVIAIVVGLVLMTLFYLAQHGGMFLFLARAIERVMGERTWLAFAGGAEVLDARITRLWKMRRRVAWCGSLRFLAWMLGTGEVWLALHFLDVPVTWTEALIVESMAQAARSAGFAIPAAIGVQEGGYVLACQALGIGSDSALALALVRRAREVLLGVPGLLLWQVTEGRRLLRDRRARLARAQRTARSGGVGDAGGSDGGRAGAGAGRGEHGADSGADAGRDPAALQRIGGRRP